MFAEESPEEMLRKALVREVLDLVKGPTLGEFLERCRRSKKERLEWTVPSLETDDPGKPTTPTCGNT